MGKPHLKNAFLGSVMLLLLTALMIPMSSASTSVAAEPVGWYAQDSGITEDLNAVAAVSTSTVWAVGNNGIILKTLDGGETWLPQDSGTALNLTDICAVDTSTAWVVGGDGSGAFIVLRTTNGGGEWETIAVGTGYYLTDIAAVSAVTAWVAGGGGVISKTADGGASWAIQTTGTTQTIYDIKAVDASTVWAAGGTGTPFNPYGSITGSLILKTTDGGGTWSSQSEPNFMWTAVAAADADDAWVVGSYQMFSGFPPMIIGACKATNDGGATWNLQLGAMSYYGADIHAVDSSTVWEIAYPGMVAKTTNGGITWSSPQYTSSAALRSICAADADNAWAVGVGGTIIHTADGGWSQPAPHIDSISPTSCGNKSVVPVQITLSGGNFGTETMAGSSYKIRFGNSTVLAADSWTDTEIKFSIRPYGGMPEPTTPGPYTVTVTTVAGGTSNEMIFTLVDMPAPVISSVSPSVGAVGDEVTISGSDFGAADLSSQVFFGNIAAGYESWSDTSIVCRVPAGTPSPALIRVATGGGISNQADFTVLAGLHGRVTDAINGEPIEGIYVCLFDYYNNPTQIVALQKTDANGDYAFDRLDAISYRIGFTDLTGVYQFEFYDEQHEFDYAYSIFLPGGQDTVIDEDLYTKASLFLVESMTPNQAAQYTFLLNVTDLAGMGFQSGATVRLEKGDVAINAFNVSVVSPNSITCSFWLFGAEPGTYDVVVTNPDGQEARLNGGFTITSPCGQGAGAGMLMLGLTLGLLSLAGSSGLFKRKNKP